MNWIWILWCYYLFEDVYVDFKYLKDKEYCLVFILRIKMFIFVK